MDLNETIESQSPREPAGLRSGSGLTRLVRGYPRIWAAVVLWLASWAFVSAFSNLARWETGAQYDGMASLCRWDCNWYGSVAESGYWRTPWRESGSVNWPFYPLFPMTAYTLRKLSGLSLPSALVLASKLELLLAIYVFLLMLGDEAETTADYFQAASLVAFNPYLIYAHAGYAEPLYFAFISLGFYFARRQRWIAGGAMGGLASGTRLVGFLFATSYATLWIKEGRLHSWWRKHDLNRAIGLLLCPLGTAIFMLYMYHLAGDALVQRHVQVAWRKIPGNPLNVLRFALREHHWPRVWAVMVAASLLLSAWLVKLRKPEMGVFLALSILIPISASYWAVPRYLWWQPPFLYAIYRLLGRNSAAWMFYTALASGMGAFMVVEWFSGHNFVA